MTKRELVIQVASRLGRTQNEVGSIVQEMLDAVTQSLAEGHRLEIRNFGVFEVRHRDARVGRNPRTGESVPIAEKRVATFKPGKTLKEWVQNGAVHPSHGLFDGAEDDARAPAASPSTVETAPSASEANVVADADRAKPGDQQSLF